VALSLLRHKQTMARFRSMAVPPQRLLTGVIGVPVATRRAPPQRLLGYVKQDKQVEPLRENLLERFGELRLAGEPVAVKAAAGGQQAAAEPQQRRAGGGGEAADAEAEAVVREWRCLAQVERAGGRAGGRAAGGGEVVGVRATCAGVQVGGGWGGGRYELLAAPGAAAGRSGKLRRGPFTS
jgi:hypothetical protein